MINKAKAAVCAAVLLLTPFMVTACNEGAAKDAIQAVRENLPELKNDIAETVRETSEDGIAAACYRAGLASPPPTPIKVGSPNLTKLENELHTEENLSAAGQDAAFAFCKAHDAATG